MTVRNECLHPCGPEPRALSYFNVLDSSNSTQYESTNQEWEWWPNVWMSILLHARYHYTSSSCAYIAFNLLGYRGPTIAKPVLCLEPGQWAWALDGSRQELYCLVEVPPLLSSLYKSPEPAVMSEEAGKTTGSMHLHHALGTSEGPMPWSMPSQGRHGLESHYWSSRSSFRPFRVWAYPGHGQGHVPTVHMYLSTQLIVFL